MSKSSLNGAGLIPRLVVFTVACLSLAGVGCARELPLDAACDPAEPAACERHLVCAPGPYPGGPRFTCQYGACYRNDECPAGELCVDLTCTALDVALGVGRPCATDLDCPRYLTCKAALEGATCRPLECYRNLDCAPDLRCKDAHCSPPGC